MLCTKLKRLHPYAEEDYNYPDTYSKCGLCGVNNPSLFYENYKSYCRKCKSIASKRNKLTRDTLNESV